MTALANDARATWRARRGRCWSRCLRRRRAQAARARRLCGVVNGIRYVQRYGIPWHAMPKGLPPGGICHGYICHGYWRVLADGGHLDRINHLLAMAGREGRTGRQPHACAC